MSLEDLLNKLCAEGAISPNHKKTILDVIDKLETNEAKYYVFNDSPGSGKTYTLALISLLAVNIMPGTKVIYVAPSYEESAQFISYLKRFSELLELDKDIKVVKLLGKDRLCIREPNRLRCKGCPYLKVRRKDRRRKNRKHYKLLVVDEKEYKVKKRCPYYNLLYQARTADIIVSHLSLLDTLWKSSEGLPYDPSKAILIIDEAHYVRHLLEPNPIKILTIEEKGVFQWINIGDENLLRLLKLIVHKPSLFNSKEDYELFKKVFDVVFKQLFDYLDPNNYIEANKTFINTLPKYLDGIKKAGKVIRDIVIYEDVPDPMDFERIIWNSKLDYEIKIILIELYWAIYLIKEIRVIRNKYKESTYEDTYEVYIVPFSEPIKTLGGVINRHSKIILSSGTLRESDIKGIKEIPPPNCPPANVYVANMSANKQDNVLVIVMQDRINICELVRRLSNNGYLVYVSHSSYNSANYFDEKLVRRNKQGFIETCTPRTRDELDNCLKKGIKIINVVQNGALSRNHRLIGDVAVVASFIGKDIKNYDSKKLLLEYSALDSFQTICRILYPERRVVLVIPKEVYDVVEGKYKKFTRMGVKIEFVRELEDIIEKIRSWIPAPTQMKKYRKEFVRTAKLIKKKAKGKVYEFAKISEILLPKEYANKKFRIIVEEL